jgi:hypothetical protein
VPWSHVAEVAFTLANQTTHLLQKRSARRQTGKKRTFIYILRRSKPVPGAVALTFMANILREHSDCATSGNCVAQKKIITRVRLSFLRGIFH